jgi:hypothetical protein
MHGDRVSLDREVARERQRARHPCAGVEPAREHPLDAHVRWHDPPLVRTVRLHPRVHNTLLRRLTHWLHVQPNTLDDSANGHSGHRVLLSAQGG